MATDEIIDLPYQKSLIKGDKVQAELPVKIPKQLPRKVPSKEPVKTAKKTELDVFGFESTDRPHIESFCVPKKQIDNLLDKLEEATSDPHKSQSKSGEPLNEVIKKLKTELKKLPVCEQDTATELEMENIDLKQQIEDNEVDIRALREKKGSIDSITELEMENADLAQQIKDNEVDISALENKEK